MSDDLKGRSTFNVGQLGINVLVLIPASTLTDVLLER